MIVLSNAGSKAIFRRNQPIFSAEYWFYKTAFDLPMKKWVCRTLLSVNQIRSSHSQLMWFLADVIGLLSINVGSFSFNVVPGPPILSANVVPKNRCNQFLWFMLSGRYTYASIAKKAYYRSDKRSQDIGPLAKVIDSIDYGLTHPEYKTY